MKSGPFYDRSVYHIEIQNVKEKFFGLFGGKVPHRVLIKFAALFALFASLDPFWRALR